MESIAADIQKHMLRREWMAQFCEHPCTFMERLVASQETDEEVEYNNVIKLSQLSLYIMNIYIYTAVYIYSYASKIEILVVEAISIDSRLSNKNIHYIFR
jgi:hypothetical protein